MMDESIASAVENQTDLQLPSELWLEVMAYSEPIALIRGLYCVNKLFHDIARRILDLQLVQFTREFEGRIKDYKIVQELYANKNNKEWNPDLKKYLIQPTNHLQDLLLIPTARITERINGMGKAMSTWLPYNDNYKIYCRIPSEDMRTNVGDYGIYPQKTIGGLLLVIDTRDLASFWDFVFWLEIVSTSQRVSPQYPRHIIVVGYYSQNRPSVASWLTFNLARLMNWKYFIVDVKNTNDWDRVWPKLIEYYSLEPLAEPPQERGTSHLALFRKRCNLQ
jgi:hypothetical protein